MTDPSGPGPDRLVLRLNRHRNLHRLASLPEYPPNAKSNRLLGCLLGLAVGDMLGCPVEGMSHDEIQAAYRGGVQELLYPRYWRHWRLPGLHSDDTQQALAVMDAVLRVARRIEGSSDEKILGREIARELAGIYALGMQAGTGLVFGCWRGTGSNFRKVVERLSRNPGTVNYPFGFGEPSAGLGAVMRIPPLGLLIEKVELLLQVVAHVTLITHTDPLSVISAGAIASACHLLSDKTPGSFQVESFLRQLLEIVQDTEKNPPDVATMPGDLTQEPTAPVAALNSRLISLAGELVAEQPDVAMRAIAMETSQLTGKSLSPTGGFSPAGVAACLYFFLHDAHEPRQALLAAINAGGDTDTIGAVVGALSGTLHGPPAFKDFLPDLVALDMIIGKAQAAIAPMRTDPWDLIEEELLLTEIESGIKNLLQRIS